MSANSQDNRTGVGADSNVRQLDLIVLERLAELLQELNVFHDLQERTSHDQSHVKAIRGKQGITTHFDKCVEELHMLMSAFLDLLFRRTTGLFHLLDLVAQIGRVLTVLVGVLLLHLDALEQVLEAHNGHWHRVERIRVVHLGLIPQALADVRWAHVQMTLRRVDCVVHKEFEP